MNKFLNPTDNTGYMPLKRHIFKPLCANNIMTEKIYTEENSEYLKNHPTWHIEDSPWKAKQIIKILKQNKI